MVKGLTGASEIGSMHIWKATINAKRYIQALEDMVQFKHLGFFSLCFELNMGWWDLYIVVFIYIFLSSSWTWKWKKPLVWKNRNNLANQSLWSVRKLLSSPFGVSTCSVVT